MRQSETLELLEAALAVFAARDLSGPPQDSSGPPQDQLPWRRSPAEARAAATVLLATLRRHGAAPGVQQHGWLATRRVLAAWPGPDGAAAVLSAPTAPGARHSRRAAPGRADAAGPALFVRSLQAWAQPTRRSRRSARTPGPPASQSRSAKP